MDAQLDFSKTTAIVCDNCKNPTFNRIVFLRRVSRFISPDGQEHVIPMDSMQCTECKHVNKDFNPDPSAHLEEEVEETPKVTTLDGPGIGK